MSRREFLSWATRGLLGGAFCPAAGCGTLLHPERHGRPHSRDIDWKIVALDGLGMILFFVPGVIAFVVDFATGAIYLPPDPEEGIPVYPLSPQPPAAPADLAPVAPDAVGLKRVVVPRAELADAARIEQVVAGHLGRPVSLDDPGARVSRLPGLGHFGDRCARHLSDASFGSDARAWLAGLRGV